MLSLASSAWPHVLAFLRSWPGLLSLSWSCLWQSFCSVASFFILCRGHFYPGTGAVDEVGDGAGEGHSVNVPWPMGGMGNGDYMAAFNHVIMPIAYEYQPDLIIISAGFDASIGDPIGG